jgi:hypothetical protein
MGRKYKARVMDSKDRVLIGTTYGDLIAIRDTSVEEGSHLAECGCFGREVVKDYYLLSGKNQMCSYCRMTRGDGYGRHRMNDTPIHRTWANMKGRCTNKTHTLYPQYGGRGISVCKRWSEHFWHFYEDMGDRPEGMTLDRIDNDGDYEPSNCKWSTQQEQTQNRSTNTLSPDKVRMIRLYSLLLISTSVISEMVVCSNSQVLDVLSGKSWNNIK